MDRGSLVSLPVRFIAVAAIAYKSKAQPTGVKPVRKHKGQGENLFLAPPARTANASKRRSCTKRRHKALKVSPSRNLPLQAVRFSRVGGRAKSRRKSAGRSLAAAIRSAAGVWATRSRAACSSSGFRGENGLAAE